ncbi:hypothetical protein DPSP01_002376 [Paraphaeosphaeria sporulosa]|uniref:Uncharacterized protein n=1 Tax=Paraphaeosphaeria sporulosa TaxID=1460663 RepID=A0A177C347_9PLEO|nr:uncharacterized protein CC84DRAFT_1221624 [Paraphaeosphaeria sporulosa]OAG01090.1 hypothetical protein CC84DRAFT_1221624 [Paraphaeosphaeria sporulosa]
MRLVTRAIPSLSAFALAADALNTTCSSFPTYNATTLATSPFTLLASSPTAPINGTAASFVSFTNDGVDRYGFVTIPQSNPTFGSAPPLSLQCTGSTLYVQLSGLNWVPVSIAADENWQRGLSFGLGEGVGVQAYAQNGDVYLGAEGGQGVVGLKWKFKSNWGGNAGQYYLVRWAGGEGEMKRQVGGEPPVVDDRDWVGYLKVVV